MSPALKASPARRWFSGLIKNTEIGHDSNAYLKPAEQTGDQHISERAIQALSALLNCSSKDSSTSSSTGPELSPSSRRRASPSVSLIRVAHPSENV